MRCIHVGYTMTSTDDKEDLKRKIVNKFLKNDIIEGSSGSIEETQDMFIESEQPSVRDILRNQRRKGDPEFPIVAEELTEATIVYIPSDRVTEAFCYAKLNEGLSGEGMDDADDSDNTQEAPTE